MIALDQQSYEQFINQSDVGTPRLFRQGWANCQFIARQVADELETRNAATTNFTITVGGRELVIVGWQLTHEFIDNGYKYFLGRWGVLYREGSKAARNSGVIRPLYEGMVDGLKEYKHLFALLSWYVGAEIDVNLVTSS